MLQIIDHKLVFTSKALALNITEVLRFLNVHDPGEGRGGKKKKKGGGNKTLTKVQYAPLDNLSAQWFRGNEAGNGPSFGR